MQSRHSPVFHFLMQPEFPINALILATEALRIANQNSGASLFEYSLVSDDGDAVRASNGMWLSVDNRLENLRRSDYVFIFEGNLPTQKNSNKFLSKLRDLYRTGATLVGIDTGAFALAQAGIATRPLVVHWEAAAAFRECFARSPISDQLYSIDGRLISCAGGVATLDLMLTLINHHYGSALSMEVANALIHDSREEWHAQRRDLQDLGDSRALSDQIISLMENHLDFPLSASDLAQQLSISLRTLERHCQRYFGSSPMKVYMGLRLQAARNFLFYQDYGIKEVALAYGFSSTSVFSRTFKAYFGQTPSAFRKELRNKQTATQLPELNRLHSARYHLKINI